MSKYESKEGRNQDSNQISICVNKIAFPMINKSKTS